MRKLLIVLVLALVFGFAIFAYWTYGNQPANAQDESQKIFVIDKGASIREIGNSLKKEGLIRDPVIFFIYIKLYGQDKNIQAGDYRLSSSMTLRKIVDGLNHGTLDRWVTISEGVRAEEIADLLAQNLLSFDESWRARLNENEGYLFPDTYLVPKDADIELVISILKGNFDKKIKEEGLDRDEQGLNRAVIIASLIEREAKLEIDRPLVSSVINNRLRIGMKLDIDATIQYALGYQKDNKRWWKQSLTNEDKKFDSPYNTYLNAGLPPTSISNPGIRAIQAALKPAATDYLYYISDATGKNHYAKTLQEHRANIQKFLE